MKRPYLEEDIALIQKYFPGARAVALRTPFDLTPKDPRQLGKDAFRQTPSGGRWYGDLLWNQL